MDRKFMDLALIEARKAMAEGDVPVGAVVVLNGNVIGVGRNRREKDKNAVAHAEILAIEQACATIGDWRLDNAELYVTLEPCPMCSGAIINARIGTVIFGAYDTKVGSLGSVANFVTLPYSFTPEVYGGICENECREVLTEFFKGIR